ncbi:transcription factor MYB23, putative [Entamoeba invadens IP1]|uniref:Transcription factor MYB23, putative n=1 Tax=Entamoeba invadens IP1 TaxID=370355 RepID=A0A0A1UFI8_ENTIV|nr:transcription factor MYB23, putative [Entamoeba invadens IP1]ELP91673.1 transcription factor MYB23, putative [Entamoeba invadens IP1]|eukprot:XP_004258444.1 transcription factor MYB23, putative [Entamoeba invadens IP1]
MSYCENSERSKHKKIVRTWRKEEDEILLKAVEMFGENNWDKVSELVPERTKKQCKERYINNLSQRNEKRKWTCEEDSTILSLRNCVGNKWTLISEKLVNRSPNAVKNRYFGHIKRLGISELELVEEALRNRSSSAFEPVDKNMFTVCN